MKRRFVLVTPETAKRWLASSKGNRATSYGTVAELRACILGEGGRVWIPSLEPLIAFDGPEDSGALVNGHHRAEAIVSAGVSVTCEIIEGMPSEMVAQLDRARPRSGCDEMRMVHGDTLAYQRRPVLSAILRVLGYSTKRGLTANRYKVLLAAIGPKFVDMATARHGRPALLRAAFAYAAPALGELAAPIWSEVCAAQMPPAASTIYRMLALPSSTNPREQREHFIKYINGFWLVYRGMTATTKLYARDEALAWADESRSVGFEQMKTMLGGA